MAVLGLKPARAPTQDPSVPSTPSPRREGRLTHVTGGKLRPTEIQAQVQLEQPPRGQHRAAVSLAGCFQVPMSCLQRAGLCHRSTGHCCHPAQEHGALRVPAAAGSRRRGQVLATSVLPPTLGTFDLRRAGPTSGLFPPGGRLTRAHGDLPRPQPGLPLALPLDPVHRPASQRLWLLPSPWKSQHREGVCRSSLRRTPCFREEGREALTGSFLRAENLAWSACGLSSRVPGSATPGRLCGPGCRVQLGGDTGQAGAPAAASHGQALLRCPRALCGCHSLGRRVPGEA